VALVVALCSCGAARNTRDQTRDRWVRTYVSELGLTQREAGCVIDRFFGELSDDELKPLTKGRELSDAQAERVGEIAIACGVGRTAQPTTSSA